MEVISMNNRICFVVICISIVQTVLSQSNYSFPDDFAFGAATSAYQIEGAWNEDGKGENIWDHYLHLNPDLVADGTNGDVACDSYHKWREDIQLIKGLSANFYRFSISWSRILPLGAANTEINHKGVEYYNNLIDGLIAEGIEPYITMYHWDLPLPLQEKGGWLNETTIDDFLFYARLLFQLYGDRVKTWITFNEFYHFCQNGYDLGTDAPFWKLSGVGGYKCAHNALVAHGKTYRLYETEYKSTQNGRVGASIDSGWYAPKTDSPSDQEAAERYIQFHYGLYVNPLIYGDFPAIVKERVARCSEQEGLGASRLPEFTPEETEIVKGSLDFLGLNHYSTDLCTFSDDYPRPSLNYDNSVKVTQNSRWMTSAATWDRYTPWGFRKLLVWIKNNYNNPRVLVTENGWANSGVNLDDNDRIEYFRGYTTELLNAMHEDGCQVIGYSPWSLIDNLEWTNGFSVKFGMVQVDFQSPNKTRTPRNSYGYMRTIFQTRRVV